MRVSDMRHQTWWRRDSCVRCVIVCAIVRDFIRLSITRQILSITSPIDICLERVVRVSQCVAFSDKLM
jgi:hypothetical protein